LIQKRRTGHGGGQRLRAAHASHAAGNDQLPFQARVEVLFARGGESLERALDDSLRADVDPRAGGHLPVHGEAHALELGELLEVVPVADQVGVSDEHTGRVLMGAEDANRLARLHQQRLVILQRF